MPFGRAAYSLGDGDRRFLSAHPLLRCDKQKQNQGLAPVLQRISCTKAHILPIIIINHSSPKNLKGPGAMLFITYFELNEEMSVEERIQIAQSLTESGDFPPSGVEVVRWDTTPDTWGILITEADSAADVIEALALWRASGAGFFEKTKTAPALPVQETIPHISQMLANR